MTLSEQIKELEAEMRRVHKGYLQAKWKGRKTVDKWLKRRDEVDAKLHELRIMKIQDSGTPT